MTVLDGLRVAVTGGGSGVGEAVARRLASDGARVAIVDIDAAAAQRVADVIVGGGGAATAVRVDVGDEASVSSGFETLVEGFGGLDALCAAAGVQMFGSDARCHELDVDVWEATHRVNIRGMFLSCKHALPHLVDAGGGSIVLIGSPTGLYGVAPGFTAYSSSKAAALGLMRVIAADYAAQGVRATMVVPGFTRTPLVRQIFDDPTLLRTELDRIPLGRAGEPGEIGALVSFLCSKDAAFATGAVFTMDGGVTAV